MSIETTRAVRSDYNSIGDAPHIEQLWLGDTALNGFSGSFVLIYSGDGHLQLINSDGTDCDNHRQEIAELLNPMGTVIASHASSREQRAWAVAGHIKHRSSTSLSHAASTVPHAGEPISYLVAAGEGTLIWQHDFLLPSKSFPPYHESCYDGSIKKVRRQIAEHGIESTQLRSGEVAEINHNTVHASPLAQVRSVGSARTFCQAYAYPASKFIDSEFYRFIAP